LTHWHVVVGAPNSLLPNSQEKGCPCFFLAPRFNNLLCCATAPLVEHWHIWLAPQLGMQVVAVEHTTTIERTRPRSMGPPMQSSGTARSRPEKVYLWVVDLLLPPGLPRSCSYRPVGVRMQGDVRMRRVTTTPMLGWLVVHARRRRRNFSPVTDVTDAQNRHNRLRDFRTNPPRAHTHTGTGSEREISRRPARQAPPPRPSSHMMHVHAFAQAWRLSRRRRSPCRAAWGVGPRGAAPPPWLVEAGGGKCPA
jgi:hypothetical protein